MRFWSNTGAIVSLLTATLVSARAHAQDTMSQWATVSPASGWTFISGSYSGDARSDVMGYYPGNGTLWVGRNEGKFTFSQFATVSPAADWTFLPGDFDADGKSDVAGYHPSNGTLHIGTNTGTSFVFGTPLTISPAAGWTFTSGDFTGDGRTDLVGQHPSNGSVWLFSASGSPPAFTASQVGQTVAPHASWTLISGDFVGDARVDVLGYRRSDGMLFWAENRLGQNPPQGFVFSQLFAISPADGWALVSGNFDGTGKADLVAQHPSTGRLWLARNSPPGAPNTFVFDQNPLILTLPIPNTGWSLVSGSFAGDGLTDVVGYQACNGALWLMRMGSPSTRMEGFAWPLSAAPGQAISFKVSGTGSGNVTFVRHKADACAVQSIEMGSTTFTPAVQTTAANADVNGSGWAQSFAHTVPAGWPSGIYSARLTNSDGELTHVPFIVKTAPNQRNGVAVIANVNTWLAYNTWKAPGVDGPGKYGGLATVSFERPSPLASPTSGQLHLTRAELWILGWLENEGFSPDVFTDIDFHNGEVTSPTYRAVVLSTHPEYWTTTMETNLKNFQPNGSVLYLGGNGVYEKGTYVDSQKRVQFRGGNVHTSAGDPGSREFHLFRTDASLAERPLLGLATTHCDVHGTHYQVTPAGASHFLLQGTGLSAGAAIGTAGLNFGYQENNGKAAGWETDRATGTNGQEILTPLCGFEGGTPTIFNPALPSGHTVLATFPAGSNGAEMTYYHHPNLDGGFVFSVGSINFGGSLVVDANLQKIVRNAVTASGVLPAGKRAGKRTRGR